MSEVADRLRWRFRLLAGCLVLTTIAFVQSSGRIVADTKLDLVVNPGGFLNRALDMWDPQGSFGQVQNQAYGYLFPMGPFFWLGHLSQTDPWIVQRSWWALILCVAFLGTVKLCDVLGIGTPLIRIFAGLAFALSPRFLTVLGPSSIEIWPSALAPWVLVPLVIGLRRGSARRCAALSALAVACVGGVNAVATFAVLPLAALWLLLAPRGPRRRALMIWWPPLVILGTAWWLVPLFLLGSYSPPFLDYIESSSITTTAATTFDALRGTTNWVPYVSNNVVAGKEFLQNPMIIVNAGVLLLLGIIGLSMRDLPHRRFLFLGLLGGLVLVTMGHTGNVQGWGASFVQEALDGVLAPLRNTHKFEVVVRLPLVLAAAHAIAVMRRKGTSDLPEATLRRSAVALIATTALVGATVPAWTGQIANRGSFEGLPAYWEQAADWLGENAANEGGTALMVPSSAFAEYIWGNSGDEPIQPLAGSAWAVRNSIPLTPSSTIRVLDSITDELAQGVAATGLAATLRRAGVEYLVVRNDLRTEVAGGRTESVYRTLDQSDGVNRVVSFGPTLGSLSSIDLDTIRTFAHGGWQSEHPAVDIYRIAPQPDSAVQNAANTPTVLGGADSLTALDSLGITEKGSVVLAQDRRGGVHGAPLVVTDGLRRQEVAFGAVDSLRSASIARNEPFSLIRRTHDYLDPEDKAWVSVPVMRGARSLESSNSRAQASAPGGVRPSTQAWSAFDGDERSGWRATKNEGWIRLRLAQATDLGTVTIRPGLEPGEQERLSVSTEDGPRTILVSGPSAVQVKVGLVGSLRISGVNLAGSPFTLAEVSSPALDVSRPLVLPRTPADWGLADTIVLGLAQGRRPGCLDVERLVRCRADVQDLGEDGMLIDRQIYSAGAARYRVSVHTSPVGGEAFDKWSQEGLPVKVRASSTVNSDVRSSVSRLLDGDERTGWIASPDDTDPSLSVQWTTPHTLSAIQLSAVRGLPASLPSAVTLELDDGSQRRVAVKGGVANFDSITTQSLVIRLESDKSAVDYAGDIFGSTLPVGFSELGFDGAPTGQVKRSGDIITLPCGTGPSIVVDGRRFPTSITTTREDLAEGRDGTSALCDSTSIPIDRGTNRVTVRASNLYVAGQIVLTRSGTSPPPGSDGPKYVVDRRNANPGWKATSGGRALVPIRMNGWQQGWVLPADSSTSVSSTFAPESTYRVALALGGLALVALLGTALLRGRRQPAADPRPSRAHARFRVAATVVTLGVLGALGGSIFVLLGLVGGGAALLAARRAISAAWVVALPLLISLLSYVLRPWGTTETWVGTWSVPQWCVAISLGALAFEVFHGEPVFQRRNGSSTHR